MRTRFSSNARAAALLASLLLSASPALSDDVRGLRSEKLVEKSHVVDLRIGHGYADMVVRRTVHNGGPRHDQATFYIDLPEGAVAVGLRTLGRVPRGAFVVVLIDASRSLDQEQVEAEVDMTRAYLSHFPDARATVLTFDRATHAHKTGFVSVNQALAGLDGAQIVRKNGSHIDDALARADALLGALPANTPKRILALTDARTRQELTPERLRGQLSKSGALLHIGVVGDGSFTTLLRDDTHAWASVTRPTGGLVWSAAIGTTNHAEENRTVFEEWARPKRIDHFAVRAQGLAADDIRAPAELVEGDGIEDLRLSEKNVSFLEVTGELWAAPVRRVLVADETENRRWAGLVFGSSLLYSIDEPDMMTLAMMGRAVSPVTSYLAIEPGVRPSTEGLEEMSGSGQLLRRGVRARGRAGW